MSHQPFRATLRPALLALAAAGCGGGEPSVGPLAPASGTITLNGKPLTGAAVYFLPESGTGPGGASEIQGASDARGVFEIKTGPAAGAPAGKYKVIVNEPVIPPVDPATGKLVPTVPVPPAYVDPGQTPLRIDVPAGGSTTLKLELKSK